jgi:hypothetical protein
VAYPRDLGMPWGNFEASRALRRARTAAVRIVKVLVVRLLSRHQNWQYRIIRIEIEDEKRQHTRMADVVEILSYTDTQSLFALGKKASDLRRQPHYVAATTFRSVMLLITFTTV